MTDDNIDEHAKQLLSDLDAIIAEAGWNTSTYLKALRDQLKRTRDDYSAYFSFDAVATSLPQNVLLDRNKVAEDECFVYISLYVQDGSILKNWQHILLNLGNQTISRPIYQQEDDIQKLVRHKENKDNEAYAVVKIKQSDILMIPSDKVSYDKLGHSLLVLKDKSIKLTNIVRFVHKDVSYQFLKGILVKESK